METIEEREKKYFKQEEREKKWDGLIAEKKYVEVVKEFDLLWAKNRHDLTFYDLVRRDQALKALGVISFIEESAKKKEGAKRESRRGKY
jgi:hypothetical protein